MRIQIVGLRLTVGTGQGHCGTAIVGNVGFQCILNGGGIVLQSLCQSVNQNVALIVVFRVIQMVSIGITISAIFSVEKVVCWLASILEKEKAPGGPRRQ